MATTDAQVSASPSSMEEQRHILSTQLAISPIEHADIAKHLPDDSVTIATDSPDPDVSSSFEVPAVYYGTFSGDIDAGSNVFKRWFWDYKITHSLRERPDEPWSEICWDPVTGALFNGSVPRAEPSLYATAAATGVELLKIDCCVYGYENRSWDYNPHDWPRGFDFLPRAHAAGLKTSLYLGGSYRDVNLSTVAGRDLELAAIQERFDAGWMDMWRTDTYTAPENPLPDSFAGVTNFLHIMDTMIARNQSFRYENCANGGHFKGLALARRFTFVTTNDNAGSSVNYRQTHWLNSHALNSVQLKCDMQVGAHNLNYTLRSCLLGSWLLAMPEPLDILHNSAYKAHIELYKTKQRPILRGGHVFHILPFPDETNIGGAFFCASIECNRDAKCIHVAVPIYCLLACCVNCFGIQRCRLSPGHPESKRPQPTTDSTESRYSRCGTSNVSLSCHAAPGCQQHDIFKKMNCTIIGVDCSSAQIPGMYLPR